MTWSSWTSLKERVVLPKPTLRNLDEPTIHKLVGEHWHALLSSDASTSSTVNGRADCQNNPFYRDRRRYTERSMMVRQDFVRGGSVSKFVLVLQWYPYFH